MKTIKLFIALLIGLSTYGQDFPAPMWSDREVGNDSVYLSWYPPTSKSLSHYNIYFYGYTSACPIMIGSTIDTTFNWPLPDFCYTMNFMLSAEYDNPHGVSDSIQTNFTILSLLDIPTEFNFDDYMHSLLTSNILSGTDHWTLTNNTSYSGTNSAQFLSTSENAKCQLLSAPFETSNVTLKFMCKIPSNGNQSDTLRVGKLNLMSHNYFSEPITHINDWQQFEFELDSLSTSLHFEAKSGMGNGIFIDDIIIQSSIDLESINNDSPSVTIYPHPVIGTSTISLPSFDHDAELKIYSTSGKLVKNKIITSECKISNNDFPSGIYLYEIILKNGEKLKGKVIIQ